MSFRNILVGLDLEPDGSDLSAGSRRAAAQAMHLATRTGARVKLFHSTARDEYWDPLTRGYVIVGIGPPPEGRSAMEALAESFRGAGIDVELTDSEERPWLAIAKQVMRGDVDLVIVGKRSRTERDGRRLGRVSQRLLRKCPGPIWVVRDTPEPAPVVRRVLAATDLTPVGGRVVRTAAEVAEQLDAELHVVHVCPVARAAWAYPGGYVDWVDSDEDAAIVNARNAMKRELSRTSLLDSAKIHIVARPAGDGILDAVREYEPDLLVMGTVSREGLAGFLIGNTAEWVLERADCSLLTIKPERFVSPIAPPREEELAGRSET